MHNLQRDTNVIIKPVDKGSAEKKKQLGDRSTYLETKLIEKDLVNLVEQSNKLFENLQRKSIIKEREKN